MAEVVGVRFKRASKIYDFDANGLDLSPDDTVIVEVEKGMGMAHVVVPPREVDPSTLKRKLKKVIRKADDVDMERQGFNVEREEKAFRVCREKIEKYKLPMKLVRVEYLFDSSKAIFYFTSETRVDFRQLVKDLAGHFHTRIEMRQIGVRDEAKMIGGIGPCGRELCCAGFLSEFEPVTIKMAKEQNLALNPSKISGICGRLMCCLGYEHGMYKDGHGPKAERGCASSCGKHGAAPPPGGREAARPGGDERDRRPRSGRRDDRRGRPEAGPRDRPGTGEKEAGRDAARPGEDARGARPEKGDRSAAGGAPPSRKKKRGRRRRRRKSAGGGNSPGGENRGGSGEKG